MDIIKILNDGLSNEERVDPGIVRGISFYPSAPMSIDLEDPTKRIGACVRAEWYRCKRYPQTNPPGLYSKYIMSFGKTLEVWLIERLQLAGVYAGSNLKFNFPSMPLISGEIDIVVKEEDGSLAVVENKTYNGSIYYAKKKLAGSVSRGKVIDIPTPKFQNAMQSFIYLHALSKIKKVYLTYIDRSAGDPENHLQFELTNETTENGSFARCQIERPFGSFNYLIPNFTIESILDGYRLLLSYLQEKKLPPRSYYLHMTPEEVEENYANGDVSKTKYEAYKRNPEKYPVSSWNCDWCSYKNQCIKDGENGETEDDSST